MKKLPDTRIPKLNREIAKLRERNARLYDYCLGGYGRNISEHERLSVRYESLIREVETIKRAIQ